MIVVKNILILFITQNFYYSIILISTRRFFARFSLEVFGTIGCDLP